MRDPVAARKPALGERARHAVRHGIDPAIAELARNLFAAEIDDRDLVQIAIAANKVTEIGEGAASNFLAAR